MSGESHESLVSSGWGGGYEICPVPAEVLKNPRFGMDRTAPSSDPARLRKVEVERSSPVLNESWGKGKLLNRAGQTPSRDVGTRVLISESVSQAVTYYLLLLLVLYLRF